MVVTLSMIVGELYFTILPVWAAISTDNWWYILLYFVIWIPILIIGRVGEFFFKLLNV